MWYHFHMKFRSTLLLFFIAGAPFFAFGAEFSRDLRVGMRGDDVRELQKFLNNDTETRIADTGAGSLGNETNYFGQATKRAVVKFQEKYGTDILTPFNLTHGTGFFGQKTREKVYSLMNNSQSLIVVEISKETSKIPIEKGDVILMFPSQYSGKPGTMITLSGAGFTASDNTIYFGNEYSVAGAVSWNGQSITFKVPNIPKGIYLLFLKNPRGESNKGQWFVVTDGVTQEPKIDSVTPGHIVRGDVMTVKGSSFSLSDNMVQYGAGVIKNIASSDGFTLVFNIPQNTLATSTSHRIKLSLPMWVYVINENGVSNAESFIFDL